MAQGEGLVGGRGRLGARFVHSVGVGLLFPDLTQAADAAEQVGLRVLYAAAVRARMMRTDVDAVRIEGGRLAELYRLHIDGAFRLAYLLTGDRAQGEDLAQDAFVRLAGRLLHLRRPGDFEAYLRRTVVNLANSYFRRRGVERRWLEREAGMRRPEVEGPPDFGVRWEMRHALLLMPPRQHTAIVLRFYEDLSETQVAELMRCRTGTVRSLVSRGMETLRIEMRGARDG